MKSILLYSLLAVTAPAEQAPTPLTPTLSGKIEISIKQGTMDADFKLSNIPSIKDYVIFLNAGFNVQYFRDSEDSFNYGYRKQYDNSQSYESFGYYFPDNTGEAKFLPKSLQFKDTGKFPVIDNIERASEVGDWKGNIAFNGKTVRADGLQAGWYPVLYDIKLDKRYEELAYDIEVTCLDCKTIHVNGSKPVSNTSATFKRSEPVQLTLFAGDYEVDEFKGNYYLNAGLLETQMKNLGETTSSYIEFLEAKLNLPYGENVVYIQTAPVTQRNSWMFVSYPSIFNIGHQDNSLSSIIGNDSVSWFRPFIAHELAHYYFGTYRSFNSELGDMLNESISEYLSLVITKQFISVEDYRKGIKRKLKQLEGETLTPMSDVKSSSDYGNRNDYVYTYAPVIWLAIEKEIGEEKMWLLLNKLLTTQTELTNYQFVIEALKGVVKDEQMFNYIESKYLTDKDAIKNAKNIVIDTKETTLAP